MKKYFAFLVLLLSCNESTHQINNTLPVNEINIINLQKIAYPALEIIEINLKKDTLCVGSTNHLLFYPFGYYKNVQEFKQSYYGSLDIDTSKQKLISISNGISNVTFLKENEDYLRLYSATIKDSSFTVLKIFTVGITKQYFLSKLFAANNIDFSSIRVVEMYSGLQGSWIYYNFDNNSLVSVSVKSDFVLY